MHLGILLLMVPNYWIHSWCVVVLLSDWDWLRRSWAQRSWPQPRSAVEAGRALVGGGRVRVALAGALLVPVALVPPLIQLEWFPLTHIPMYGSYAAPGVHGGIPVENFADETLVREVARRCIGSETIGFTRRCPWATTIRLTMRLELQLSGPEAEPMRFSGRLDRLRRPLVDLLAATPANSQAPGSKDDVMADTVRALLEVQPAGSLAGYDRFTLEYPLSEGSIPLAAGRFEPAH
jgi:hypothetical protein